MATIKFPGTKPEVKIDIEKLKYCETLKDGTQVEFIRVFRYEDGILAGTTDVELDGSTAYTVTDPANVKSCEPEKDDVCFITKKWIFDTESIPAGVTEKLWELNNTDGTGFGVPGGAVNNPILISDLFDGRDECGIPVHPNDEDAIVSILPQAIPTDTSAANITNQNELDFWLCIDRAGIKVNARVNGFSSYAVYFGSCNEKLQLIEEGKNTTAAGTNFIDIPLGVLPEGFFHVRLFSNDPSSFGKTLLQWDVGNGFEDIPTENLISERPSASCVDLIFNKTEGVYKNLDGTDFDDEKFKCFSCDPCGVPSGFPFPPEPVFDIEKETFCETLADGTKVEFLRVFKYADGLLLETQDLTLDAASTYTVVDEANVESCQDDPEEVCELVDIWVCEGGVNGVTEQIWEASAVGGAVTIDENLEDGFTQLDECGLVAHDNAPDTTSVKATPQTTNINTANAANQNQLDFYIKLDEDTTLVIRRNGFHSGILYAASCYGKLVPVSAYQQWTTASDADLNLGLFCAGIYKMRINIHDPGSSGAANLEYINSAGNSAPVPASWVYTTPPSVKAQKAWLRKSDGKYLNTDLTEIDETAVEIKCYNPCNDKLTVGKTMIVGDVKVDAKDVEQKILCDKALTGETTKFIRHTVYAADGTVDSEYDTTLDSTAAYVPAGIVSDCDSKCSTKAMWNEVISVGDSTPVALDLSGVNAGTDYCDVTCAKIQVLGGTGYFTVNSDGIPGNADNDPAGFRVDECGIIELGCCGDGFGCKDELSDFRIIAESGQSIELRVTYFRPKN